MYFTYLLTFCRVVVGVVFALSFVGKVRDITAFEISIVNFSIIPSRLSVIVAIGILALEVTVVIFMVVGREWLMSGFALAILLLLVFSSALTFSLLHHKQVSCNCFGSSNKPVSLFSLWRNSGLALCAGIGYVLLLSVGSESSSPSPLGWGLIILVATIFIAFCTQIDGIVQLFQQGR